MDYVLFSGLCKDTESENEILPSIEHFRKRLDSPRVYFLFYNNFFRGVVGEKRWKSNLKEIDGEDNKKRMGTEIAEAYAFQLLENNYFAWLFDYKVASKKCSIKTEYDSNPVEESINHGCGGGRERGRSLG